MTYLQGRLLYFYLSLYCTDQNFENKLNQDSVTLFDRLQDELYETGLIGDSGEKIEYEGNETLGTKPRTISNTRRANVAICYLCNKE